MLKQPSSEQWFAMEALCFTFFFFLSFLIEEDGLLTAICVRFFFVFKCDSLVSVSGSSPFHYLVFIIFLKHTHKYVFKAEHFKHLVICILNQTVRIGVCRIYLSIKTT